MTHTEYLARLSLDTAGTLTRLGAKVLAATSINGRPWVKARLPARISPPGPRPPAGRGLAVPRHRGMEDPLMPDGTTQAQFHADRLTGLGGSDLRGHSGP